ncbi:hypothetical protein Dvar_43810 [Desulfosarcina variabilis str. Montpellier]|uniref:hypothetical protein n=1 Tax=Desulfosarcina variabilis TaxID=2300 RepID=UPI003AFB695E
MKKIIITGAGSAQSNGVINSLVNSGDDEQIIGLGADPTELVMCKAHKKYLMPYAVDAKYKETLLKVLNAEKPNMIHFQHDLELAIALNFRDEIEATGVKMLVPDYDTIDTCVHKYKSWQKFKDAGIKVPENRVINNDEDLKAAFRELGNKEGTIWLRLMSIGGGGKGALPTNDYQEAYEWIDNSKGWGDFVAAELLEKDTITWLSIWNEGELIVGQGRKRHGWAHSALSVSGVTGVTKVGETCHDDLVDNVAMQSVRAVSKVPNGIYGVDMTYDKNGIPNPTEINISRFFTTVEFFTQAGLNMPKIFKDLVLYNKKPELKTNLNPLEDGLLWLRIMDCAPMLTTKEKIERELVKIW